MMADQTESASEDALKPVECVEYLDDIVAKNAAGARNILIPIELLSDSAAALRALEAKVKALEHTRDTLYVAKPFVNTLEKMLADADETECELRADRDRLAGEVERLTNMLDAENSRARRLADLNDHLVEKVTRRAFTEKAQDEVIDGLVSETRRMDAEVARLTSELAAAREDLAQRREHMRRGMQSGVNTARARGDG